MGMILIRGLPGSGKSTLAGMFATADAKSSHIETDMFWGRDYNFDINRIGEAHQWCQENVRNLLVSGFSPVVSNTFTTKKELKPYFDMAKEFGITPQVITCHGRWKSVHGVPDEVMERMAGRFEYDLSSLFE
jgi:predicted kinase